MLGIRLVRLIEEHSEELSRGLTEQIRSSERTSDFRKIPAQDLRLAATEVYRNLGECLLQKTERDIATRFEAIGLRRSAEGIGLQQVVWALMLTRERLWRFLQREAFADNVVELHGELEFQRQLNQFFDLAIYHAILGYQDASLQLGPKSELRRARDLAISIGLMESRESGL